MSSDDRVSKRIIFWIGIISVLVILILGGAFLLFAKGQKNSDVVELDTGTVIMTYSDDTNVYALDNLVATKDSDGVRMDKYYDFSVSTTFAEASEIEYEVALTVDKKNSTIDPSNIHVYLEKQKSGTYIKVFSPKVIEGSLKKSEIGVPAGSFSLTKASKKTDSVDNYRLRMWVKEDANISEQDLKKFAVKIEIFGKAK